MNVHFRPIGWEVRCYNGEGSYESKSPYLCTFTVYPDHYNYNDTCIVTLLNGELTHELNILIGQKCKELGFKTLRFGLPRGQKGTRMSQPFHQIKDMDWYEVDLSTIPEEK